MVKKQYVAPAAQLRLLKEDVMIISTYGEFDEEWLPEGP